MRYEVRRQRGQNHRALIVVQKVKRRVGTEFVVASGMATNTWLRVARLKANHRYHGNSTCMSPAIADRGEEGPFASKGIRGSESGGRVKLRPGGEYQVEGR